MFIIVFFSRYYFYPMENPYKTKTLRGKKKLVWTLGDRLCLESKLCLWIKADNLLNNWKPNGMNDNEVDARRLNNERQHWIWLEMESHENAVCLIYEILFAGPYRIFLAYCLSSTDSYTHTKTNLRYELVMRYKIHFQHLFFSAKYQICCCT